jgi:iron(III) transport system substrate-binding protein
MCIIAIVLFAGASLFLAGALLLAGCGATSAPPAQEVVVYCSVDEDVAEPILKVFEQETGIHVLARYDTENMKTVGLVEKLRAEAARPVADVFWSGEVFHTILLARQGALESYRSDVTAAWPAGLADAEGRWYGFALRVRALVYNTARVKAAEAPARIEDLLDSRWRGRIVMASPESGTTGGHVASWFAWYGEERAQQILAGLKANDVRLVAGNSVVVRLVADGEADVGLTDSDDVYAGQRNKWPVAMKLVGHGTQGPLVIPNTAALVKGGPHPEAARRLMAFLLGEDVERRLARSDSHNTPVHASLAGEFPEYAITGRLPVDYEKVADCTPAAIRAATKILK